jgi:hypothetical protein
MRELKIDPLMLCTFRVRHPEVTKSEDFMMRKIFLAAIATLAVAFGNLAAASAAPHVGDASAPDQQSTDSEQGATRHSRDDVLVEAYIQLVARSQGWVAVPPGTRPSTYNIVAGR